MNDTGNDLQASTGLDGVCALLRCAFGGVTLGSVPPRFCIVVDALPQFEPVAVPNPRPSSLTGSAVEVWFAPLDLSAEPSMDDLCTLSNEESRRAEGMAAIPRRQFIAARTLLRSLLGSYLSAEPGSIEIVYNATGKPRLGNTHADHGLHFNVSHSQNRALLAFGRSPLGIDLETIRPLRNMERLASRFLSDQESQALSDLPAPVRSRAFFACWTRKEAYVKAIGTGIGLPLKSFSVTLAPGLEPALLKERRGRDPDWTLRHLEPEDGVVGALAIQQRECLLRCWRIRPDH